MECGLCSSETRKVYAYGKVFLCEKCWLRTERPIRIAEIQAAEGEARTFKILQRQSEIYRNDLRGTGIKYTRKYQQDLDNPEAEDTI